MPHQAGNYHKTTRYTTEGMDCVGSRIPIEEISALRSPSKEELPEYIYPPYNVAIHKPSYNPPSFHYPGRGVEHSIVLILPHQFCVHLVAKVHAFYGSGGLSLAQRRTYTT